MPLFTAQSSGAAPLIIQLAAPDGVVAYIREATAVGENSLGSASRPQLYVPSTPGTASGDIAIAVGARGAPGRCTAGKAFSAMPSVPASNIGAFNLPIQVHLRFPEGLRPVVFGAGSTSYKAWYANYGGLHTWEGTLLWEEK